jgi:hypothetical protein
VYHERCYLVAHRNYPYIAGSLLLSVFDVYYSLTENCNTYCLLPFASLFTVSLASISLLTYLWKVCTFYYLVIAKAGSGKGSAAIGALTIKVEPLFGLDKTSMLPSCKSRIFLTQYKPKPVPLTDAESSLSILENFLNNFCRFNKFRTHENTTYGS